MVILTKLLEGSGSCDYASRSIILSLFCIIESVCERLDKLIRYHRIGRIWEIWTKSLSNS